MDKRVVVFLVLSLAIILGFDLFIRQMGWAPDQNHPQPPTEDAAGPGSSAELEPAPAPGIGKDSGSTSSSLLSKSAQKPGAPSSDITPTILEQTVTVETDLVRVGLSNRGGVIRTWELKRYHTSPPEKSRCSSCITGEIQGSTRLQSRMPTSTRRFVKASILLRKISPASMPRILSGMSRCSSTIRSPMLVWKKS